MHNLGLRVYITFHNTVLFTNTHGPRSDMNDVIHHVIHVDKK